MNRNKALFVVVSVIALVLFSAGCRTSQASKVYTRGEAQRALEVYYGTVLSVADVTIEAEETGAGAATGAVVGGIVGSTIGGGDGRTLATVGGVLAGAAAGSATERAMARRAALEIEVELDNGQIMVIVQEKDDVFAVGDRVRVIETGYGRYRVRQ
jgi:outer membrane lipoprotein SlyB